MSEMEIETLEQIWKGKTSWGPEWEKTLDELSARDYIEIVEKRQAAGAGQTAVDEILINLAFQFLEVRL